VNWVISVVLLIKPTWVNRVSWLVLLESLFCGSNQRGEDDFWSEIWWGCSKTNLVNWVNWLVLLVNPTWVNWFMSAVPLFESNLRELSQLIGSATESNLNPTWLNWTNWWFLLVNPTWVNWCMPLNPTWIQLEWIESINWFCYWIQLVNPNQWIESSSWIY
jgi:hypothetical protein